MLVPRCTPAVLAPSLPRYIGQLRYRPQWPPVVCGRSISDLHPARPACFSWAHVGGWATSPPAACTNARLIRNAVCCVTPTNPSVCTGWHGRRHSVHRIRCPQEQL